MNPISRPTLSIHPSLHADVRSLHDSRRVIIGPSAIMLTYPRRNPKQALAMTDRLATHLLDDLRDGKFPAVSGFVIKATHEKSSGSCLVFSNDKWDADGARQSYIRTLAGRALESRSHSHLFKELWILGPGINLSERSAVELCPALVVSHFIPTKKNELKNALVTISIENADRSTRTRSLPNIEGLKHFLGLS